MFKIKYEEYLSKVEECLNKYIKIEKKPQKKIYEAMKYSLEAGGKRIRPVLMLATCELLEGNPQEIMPLACALEMIHTYSLIHDDLPCMDDDDLRRGKPTNHKVFGEAIAVLAGDGLLNMAFEIMIGSRYILGENYNNYIKAVSLIASSAGVNGMIGGQVVDIESENKAVEIDMLNYMHELKTGALFKAAVLPPAILLHGYESTECKVLEVYAKKIGMAFQIKDDILDVEGNLELIGKPVGSDQLLNKSTYVKIYGLDKSKEILEGTVKEALEMLEVFGDKAEFLRSIAEYLVTRSK